MIEVKNLSFSLDGNLILKDINIAFEDSRFYCLLGPNGSGKTTLIKNLLNLYLNKEGEILCNGESLREKQAKEISKLMAYIPQTSSFDFEFTVFDYVSLGRAPYLGAFASLNKKDKKIINEALEECDIWHLKDRYIYQLSGGEQQRVLIARSLATEANIFIMDEPTSHLDPSHSLAILGLCKELCLKGKTIIMSIHDINLALEYSDTLVILKDGKLASIFDCNKPNFDLLGKVFDIKMIPNKAISYSKRDS